MPTHDSILAEDMSCMTEGSSLPDSTDKAHDEFTSRLSSTIFSTNGLDPFSTTFSPIQLISPTICHETTNSPKACLDFLSSISYSKPESLDHAPQLIFLDLDNTLIPTAWMLAQWKLHGVQKGTEIIQSQICQSGLLKVLELFFQSITTEMRFPCQIVIVTNASPQIIHNMYLTQCMPELDVLLKKYKIPLHSTQHWMDANGPAPSLYEAASVCQFYTNAKYYQFEQELKQFKRNVLEEYGELKRINVISVGDQVCEIAAAVRLAMTYSSSILVTKLIFVANSLFSKLLILPPADFKTTLESVLSSVSDLLNSYCPTIEHEGNCTFDQRIFGPCSYLINDYMLCTCRTYVQNQIAVDSKKKSTHKKVPSPTSYDQLLHCDCDKRLIWCSKTDTVAYCIGTPDLFEYQFGLSSSDIGSAQDTFNDHDSTETSIRLSVESDQSIQGLLNTRYFAYEEETTDPYLYKH